MGEMHAEEDWRSGNWNLITVFQPTLLASLGGGRVVAYEQHADRNVVSKADGPPPFTPIMVPANLNHAEEDILRLLAEAPRDRVTTPQIADRVGRPPKSIGKNLVDLRRAGLIDNIPRKGYRITEAGIALASKR